MNRTTEHIHAFVYKQSFIGDMQYCKNEPHRVCRLQLLSKVEHHEQDRGGCGNLNSRDKWIFRATAA